MNVVRDGPFWLVLTLFVASFFGRGAVRYHPGNSPVQTQIKIFAPWNSGGMLQPDVHIRSQNTFPKLSCQAGSLVTQRPDAWRCGTDDPCFAPPSPAFASPHPTLACAPSGPWSGSVQLLSVGSPLRSASDCRKPPTCRGPIDLTRPPWAVEMANGVRCLQSGGTPAIVAGLGMIYHCTGRDGSPAGYAGPASARFDPSAPVWRLFYQAQGSSTLEAVDVLVAWY